MAKEGIRYLKYSSPIGRVFIPADEVEIGETPRIRYEQHPWIEQFEFDGMVPKAPHRSGYGVKTPLQFVNSLSNIYADAYGDCYDYGYTVGDESSFNATAYFAHVADHFLPAAQEPGRHKLFRLFCGFTENLWREGTEEAHDIAMTTLVPIIEADPVAREMFYDHITDEFRDYIHQYNKR